MHIYFLLTGANCFSYYLEWRLSANTKGQMTELAEVYARPHTVRRIRVINKPKEANVSILQAVAKAANAVRDGRTRTGP